MSPQEVLAKAFLAGAADLRRREPLINRINVFPVIDADTGTNMTRTLDAAVKELETNAAASLSYLAESLRSPLLRQARGNSGVIFSQFLVAFLDTIGEMNTLTHDSFTAAVSRGQSLAYRAVANPVEGTILTTITDLAHVLTETTGINDMDAHAALELHLSRSVARTPSLMPRLEEAGVVDSGALGFHIFASGLTLALPALADPAAAINRMNARVSGENEAPLGVIANSISPGFWESRSLNDSAFRYCIDMLIELSSEPLSEWTAPFEKLGSSVDTARGGNLLKLHLHGNDTTAIKRAGEKLGRILEFTHEDMTKGFIREQAQRDKSDMGHVSFRVVSDSSMSLSHEMADALDIHRIENYVDAHGKMLRDKDLDRNLLFTKMRDGHVFTTAQTSADDVRSFLDRMLRASDHLFFISVGNAYSGTQNLVRQVVSKHPDRERITILDTGAASGQQGLICWVAARYSRIASNETDLIHYINNQISSCREYLVIDNLKYLSRTGRIGKIKAAFAGALSVKPIVGHGGDGAITIAKVHSHEAAIHEISKRIAAHPGDGRLLVMLEYTDNLDWVERAAKQLEAALPKDTEMVFSPLSSTSAVHMGPGTWGVTVTRV